MYFDSMDSDSFDSDGFDSDSEASDSTASDSMLPRLWPTAPAKCAVCSEKSARLLCSGCKVVHYCSVEHQEAHRSNHRVRCSFIKNTREILEHEKSKLQAQSSSEDVFQTGVGHFWGIVKTRDYMIARFGAAKALLQVHTKLAVESALEHFNEMIQLCRCDDQGVRDIIPHLQLRLGREQECYHFLKWWATAENPWDVTTPYLHLPEADPLEPVDIFSSKEVSVSHLVALTLLKLRLFLDMEACSTCDLCVETDKSQIGHCVRKKIREMNTSYFEQTAQILQHQYLTLCNKVHDANPYIWGALVDGEIPTPPQDYRRGSREEAHWVVYQCHRAWSESGDAMGMINSATAAFTTVYQGQATATSGRDTSSTSSRNRTFHVWSKTRGKGRAFPSRFQSIHPPVELFVPTVTAGSDTSRFVHRNDPAKVLVFVDGACSNNGQQEPRAGWAVVFGSPTNRVMNNDCHTVSGRLENKGPFGGSKTATSNRAELRATIAALRLCNWQAEGYANLVIATDSSYVVDGATEWTKGWVWNGWKNSTGGDVKNRDLWELVLGEVERWFDKGLAVHFWKIPRELNQEADRAAKRITQTGSAVEEFEDFTLNSGQARISRQLPPSCSPKASHVDNMEKSATLYSEGKRSAEDPVTSIFVGGFSLVYSGDLNEEEASD